MRVAFRELKLRLWLSVSKGNGQCASFFLQETKDLQVRACGKVFCEQAVLRWRISSQMDEAGRQFQPASNTGCVVHAPWGRRADGSWSTADEAAYPVKLCTEWAAALRSAMEDRGIRSMSHSMLNRSLRENAQIQSKKAC